MKKIKQLKSSNGDNVVGDKKILQEITKHINDTFRSKPEDLKSMDPLFTNSLNAHNNIDDIFIENDSDFTKQANIKRTKSKLWYYMTRINKDYRDILTRDFTDYEIKRAIASQSNLKAVGLDFIPAELYKNNCTFFTNHLEKIFKHYNNSELPKDWKQGIIALFFKKGKENDINNYRPICLLQTIYKIWATILTNRLSPILNLLTNDNQCAYKAKRSTYDAIYYIKKNFSKNLIDGHIAFDLSKAFDRIDRNKLWWTLYRKGLPIRLINFIINGHSDNTLSGRHNGNIGKAVNNDKGVFQGSPISALLYIIFADGIMEEYKEELKNSNTDKIKIISKNLHAEYKWTEFLTKTKQKSKKMNKKPKKINGNHRVATKPLLDRMIASCFLMTQESNIKKLKTLSLKLKHIIKSQIKTTY